MSDRGPEGRNGVERRVAVVKKYANRRLYNMATSSYVTLEDLGRMVREGEEFVVYDARTGEDITRSVLTQIILEEDAKGRNPLPIGFLRRLIALYDDSMRSLLARYLELSLENFVRHQEQLRTYLERALGPFAPPIGPFEELARQNLALFRQAMGMFSPFGGPQATAGEERAPAREAAGEPLMPAAEAGEGLAEKVRTLEAQLGELRAQLARLQEERISAGAGVRRSTKAPAGPRRKTAEEAAAPAEESGTAQPRAPAGPAEDDRGGA